MHMVWPVVRQTWHFISPFAKFTTELLFSMSRFTQVYVSFPSKFLPMILRLVFFFVVKDDINRLFLVVVFLSMSSCDMNNINYMCLIYLLWFGIENSDHRDVRFWFSCGSSSSCQNYSLFHLNFYAILLASLC